jgi:8-oxo-dGTP pyrophosphatase MutT (NUDIX family)
LELSKTATRLRIQYGVLPYRQGPVGRTQIALVTSRESRRWVIPKGWPERGLAPHAAAAREAREEAGLIGEVGHEAIGSYRYLKRMSGGTSVLCEVRVFPLRVRRQFATWPERMERRRKWFSRQGAARAVDETGLRELIGEFRAPPRKP